MDEKTYNRVTWVFGIAAALGRFFVGFVIGSIVYYILVVPRRYGPPLLPSEYQTWKTFWCISLPLGFVVMFGGKPVMRRIFGRFYNEDVPD